MTTPAENPIQPSLTETVWAVVTLAAWFAAVLVVAVIAYWLVSRLTARS